MINLSKYPKHLHAILLHAEGFKERNQKSIYNYNKSKDGNKN